MTAIALLGAIFGAGLLTIVRGLRRRPLRLDALVSRLNRPALLTDAPAVPVDQRVPPAILNSRLFARVRGVVTPGTGRDLRILGRTADRHAFDKISCALAMLIMPLAFNACLGAIGMALPGGALMTTFSGLVGCAAGFVLPDVLLKSHAATRRRSFEHALSSYVDLVNVLLAGGAGVESALEAAAEAGDGPTFQELRSALVRSRTMRRSHWDVFAELGDALGVEPLSELAASMQLAGEQGARVRLSLAAKAASLRARQMGQIEAAAESASERMGLPVAAMFLGFLVFLGYPAIQQIINS